MQILEDHNRQLESQLQRLRQLLEQVSSTAIWRLIKRILISQTKSQTKKSNMNSKYVRNLGEKSSLQRQNQSNKSVTYRLRFIFVQFHSKCQGIPNNIIVVICGIHNDRIFIFTKPAKIVYINYINSRLLDIRISRCFFVFFPAAIRTRTKRFE